MEDENDNPFEQDFREALNEVPTENDDSCGDDSCSYDKYRSRSARVAKQFRKAASFLPE